MELYFIRHAIAVDPDGVKVKNDFDRYLSDEGIDKFKRSTKTLVKVIRGLDVVYTSPLVRARQTADLLVERFGVPDRLIETSTLAPGVSFNALSKLVSQHPPSARIALVGHEPDLSMMISAIVTGDPCHAIRMKKGAACRVDCGKPLTPRSGELVWLLQPKLLSEL